MRHIEKYSLLTFYKFVDIPEDIVHQLVDDQWQFTHDIGLKGRVYIGTEGISSTVTGNEWQLRAYRAYLEEISYFQNILDIDTKATRVQWHEFEKMIVKYREEIVTLGEKVTADEVQKYHKPISSGELKSIIDEGRLDEYLILDMRNDYEYRLGHFKGAIPAGTTNFREVPKLLERYKEAAKNKKIIWYCTGGVRCEKAAVIMNKAGIEEVYSLDGGVVKYVNEYNDGNWLGNLYTFDGRVSTQVGDSETHTTIGICLYTGAPTDHVENCRYAPCNTLIIADKKEFQKHGGFCSKECFEGAKWDGLVKNVDFDVFDYKNTLRRTKRGETPNGLQNLQDHLDRYYGKIVFPHEKSQKEVIFSD